MTHLVIAVPEFPVFGHSRFGLYPISTALPSPYGAGRRCLSGRDPGRGAQAVERAVDGKSGLRCTNGLGLTETTIV